MARIYNLAIVVGLRFCLDFVGVKVHAWLQSFFFDSIDTLQQPILLSACLLKGLVPLILWELHAVDLEAVALSCLVSVEIDRRCEVDDVLVLIVWVGSTDSFIIFERVDRAREIIENFVNILHFIGLVLFALMQIVLFLEVGQHHVETLWRRSIASDVDRELTVVTVDVGIDALLVQEVLHDTFVTVVGSPMHGRHFCLLTAGIWIRTGLDQLLDDFLPLDPCLVLVTGVLVATEACLDDWRPVLVIAAFDNRF